MRYLVAVLACALVIGDSHTLCIAQDGQLRRIKYNHPGLVVDLGVGLWAWPLPMDFDGDGDFDLVVSCPDKPYNGIYFFENTEGDVPFPVFRPAVRVSKGLSNVQVSFVEDESRVLTPGFEYPRFREVGLDERRPLGIADKAVYTNTKLRAKQWKYLDYDNDGALDIVCGYGDWTEYGWDDAYNAQGEWTNGPLHGYVLLNRNSGTTSAPVYEAPEFLQAAGKRIDVFGWPTPNFADFDGDGDLDLLCGEFRDSFTYFQNIGTREQPEFAKGQPLKRNGDLLKMDLQMIVPVAIDWDKDGDVDLICGDEDGRVAFLEHVGTSEGGVPEFQRPRYFQQIAEDVKFGALATPYGVDWDADGDVDIISGNTAGYIGFIENLGGGSTPKWARPQRLKASDETIRIMAGKNGSIQGPCESKWGYTTVSVADWDHDGLLDIVANSIWGQVIWFRNVGTAKAPVLDSEQPILVAWTTSEGADSTETSSSVNATGPSFNGRSAPKPHWNWWDPKGNELVTQWRTTPAVVDWNADGLADLIMLDHEGELAFFERAKVGERLVLRPGKRIFTDDKGGPLALVRGRAGKSGRRKLQVVDWDQDGKLDLLFNSVNADFYRNVGTVDGLTRFENLGPIDGRKISGHTSSPTVVDWDKDGVPDLLVGAEDGYFYYKPNPLSKH